MLTTKTPRAPRFTKRDGKISRLEAKADSV